MKELMTEAGRLIGLGFDKYAKRAERTAAVIKEKSALLKLGS